MGCLCSTELQPATDTPEVRPPRQRGAAPRAGRASAAARAPARSGFGRALAAHGPHAAPLRRTFLESALRAPPAR
jgi:hypothetical protein